ncbi:FAD-dependent oxidoreductase [Archangium gephyra]|uniref:FAD-dependent oxidoreductase n=1 Tax=Archangium gephyra TaxID=48 RepID=UPI0035D48943
MPQASKPKKIAILGGGMAGLTAAFELTRHPDWKQHYEVTVYQQGWRLGGKGASGRNQEKGQGLRSEEHGFHVLMGFYTQTLGMLEDCYEELGKIPEEQARPHRPFPTLKSALDAHDEIHFMETVDNEQHIWRLRLEPREQPALPAFQTLWSELGLNPGNNLLPPRQGWSDADRLTQLLLERMQPALESPFLGDTTHHLIQKVRNYFERTEPSTSALSEERELIPILAQALLGRARTEQKGRARATREQVIPLLEQARGDRHALAERLASGKDESRRLRILLDLGFTISLGLNRNKLANPKADLGQLDMYDFKEWLRLHGAEEESIHSAVVEAGYNLTFSAGRTLAAGAALQGLLQMLDYHEHLFFKMKAGMGEVVIAPLYRVLAARGVRFEFFQCVETLHLSKDKQRIASIDMLEQVALKSPEAGYDPFLQEVEGLPCWPVTPRYDQLRGGEDLRKRSFDFEAPPSKEANNWRQWQDVRKWKLELGEDFDHVVLGISIGAFRELCPELLANDAGMRQMVENIPTTATQATQLWFSEKLDDGMGWKRHKGVMACCPRPFDTWADCSQVLGTERWAGTGKNPKTVVYLCGPLDEGAAAPPTSVLTASASSLNDVSSSWLTEHLGMLWPEVTPRLQQTDTFTVDGGQQPLIVARYHRKSIHPSDRYVLTPPGSTRYRLPSHGTRYDNLLLAGDWVLTQLNTGCVESAVLAGQQAAEQCRLRLYFDTPGQEEETTLKPPRLPGPVRYIESQVASTWPGPFRQRETLLHSFFLECDIQALQSLCDTFFNELQQEHRYEPLGNFAILQCARIDRSESQHEEFGLLGVMKEREIGISIPLIGRSRTAQGTYTAERFLLFQPYLFVDTGAAMAVGREIYGFAKQHAHLHMPEKWGQRALFSASPLVIHERGGVASMQELLQVVRLRPDGKFPEKDEEIPLLQQPPERERFDDINTALTTIGMGLMTHPRVQMTDSMEGLLGSNTRMLFLKQFRDAQDTSRACYQAIVEAPFTFPTPLRIGARLPDDFRIRFKPHYSHPLANDLGLKMEQDGTVTPLLATVLELDFDLEHGLEMWRAGSLLYP